MQRAENNFFLGLLVAASLALAWIILPYFGAILWGVIAAILFAPVNRGLLDRMPGHRNSAALLTLLLIVAVVVVPAVVLSGLLIQELTAIYERLRDGQIDFVAMFRHLQAMLPRWTTAALDRFGLMDFDQVRTRLSSELADSIQTIAGKALSLGWSAFNMFVTIGIALYLAFFLLRDGEEIATRIDNAVPLPPRIRTELATRFITVTRATINGSMVVAITQGTIGGVTFSLLGIPGALLWGVMMAFFSLLPAIGSALIWLPVALYLFASGALGKALILTGCGMFVIGMVDNVLRPILVGRDTRIPDYVVLISTLGGLEIFGFNGIIIGPVIAALFLSVWQIFIATRNGEAIDAP